MGASVWECTCGSRAAPRSPPPPLTSPLPLPFALRCLLHIGCQGPDVRGSRWSGLGGRASSGIRPLSLALQLLWQQGKQPPRGKGSGAHRRSWVPPPSGLTPSPFLWQRSSRLPGFLLGLSVSRTWRPALDLRRGLPAPHPANSHPKSATSRSRQEANFRCLVTCPRAPSPLFTPDRGGGD